jgi:hypothetical protein
MVRRSPVVRILPFLGLVFFCALAEDRATVAGAGSLPRETRRETTGQRVIEQKREREQEQGLKLKLREGSIHQSTWWVGPGWWMRKGTWSAMRMP